MCTQRNVLLICLCPKRNVGVLCFLLGIKSGETLQTRCAALEIKKKRRNIATGKCLRLVEICEWL